MRFGMDGETKHLWRQHVISSYNTPGSLVRRAFILCAVLVVLISRLTAACTVYADDMPPSPQPVASYDLGWCSDNPQIMCLSSDGRYAVVSSADGDRDIANVVNLDTGERYQLPDTGYDIYDCRPLTGSRVLVVTEDGVAVCDLATVEVEPLSIDIDQGDNIVYCRPLDDGKTIRLVMSDEDGVNKCIVFDVDTQAVIKRSDLRIPGVRDVCIGDDAEHIYALSEPEERVLPYVSVYNFDEASPQMTIRVQDPDVYPWFIVRQVDESVLLLAVSVDNGWSYCRLDLTTGELEPVVDAAFAANWIRSAGGTLTAIVDPVGNFGETVSSDALGRMEVRSVDISNGKVRYQCQVPALIYGLSLQHVTLSRDGRYFYAPNDSYASSSRGLTGISVLDVSTGALTNAPLSQDDDGSELLDMSLSEDDGRLVLLTINDTGYSNSTVLSVYDTGIGGSASSILDNAPVLIIVVVSLALVVLIVVGLLVFMGRRRRAAAPAMAGTYAAAAPTAHVPAAAPGVSFCPQCGQRIETPGAAFCPRCGTSLKH